MWNVLEPHRVWHEAFFEEINASFRTSLVKPVGFKHNSPKQLLWERAWLGNSRAGKLRHGVFWQVSCGIHVHPRMQPGLHTPMVQLQLGHVRLGKTVFPTMLFTSRRFTCGRRKRYCLARSRPYSTRKTRENSNVLRMPTASPVVTKGGRFSWHANAPWRRVSLDVCSPWVRRQPAGHRHRIPRHHPW